MADNDNNSTSRNSANNVLSDADKQILQEIDTQLKETEAIIYYKQVKNERDEFKQGLEDASGALRRASATIQRLERELRNRDELKQILESREKALEKSQNRIGELESLKVIVSTNGAGNATAEGAQTKTLLEMEKAFLEAKGDEVRRRATELFDSMKAEWEQSEKPRLPIYFWQVCISALPTSFNSSNFSAILVMSSHSPHTRHKVLS